MQQINKNKLQTWRFKHFLCGSLSFYLSTNFLLHATLSKRSFSPPFRSRTVFTMWSYQRPLLTFPSRWRRRSAGCTHWRTHTDWRRSEVDATFSQRRQEVQTRPGDGVFQGCPVARGATRDSLWRKINPNHSRTKGYYGFCGDLKWPSGTRGLQRSWWCGCGGYKSNWRWLSKYIKLLR